MKTTYEWEEHDSKGNCVKSRIIIEEERCESSLNDMDLGDGRSPFINKHSRKEDIRDYDKYSQAIHRSSMKSILDSYEDFLMSKIF